MIGSISNIAAVIAVALGRIHARLPARDPAP
jgi:hypothetical protein